MLPALTDEYTAHGSADCSVTHTEGEVSCSETDQASFLFFHISYLASD